MELQFYKKEIPCMRPVINQTVQQELTQEIKLPDNMPEIGRVIGAWGQVLLRGKQWHSSSLEATGGVMAKVLYLSESDSQPHCVEAWVPFQIQAEFPKADRDGKFNLCGHLRFADARSVSARKIMYRAGVTAVIDAFVPDNMLVYRADEVPKNLHLLTKTYPVCIPGEMGEKAFAMDELLSLPAACPPINQMVYCALRPEVIDKKLLAEKVVFRGMAVLSIFYVSEDGSFCSHDFEIPFSQYEELDYDYDDKAMVSVDLAVTALDVDVVEDGKIAMKAGVLAQYTVCGYHMLEVVEDVYSSTHETEMDKESLRINAVLDVHEEPQRIEAPVQAEVMRVLDVTCCCDGVEIKRNGDTVDMNALCWYQVLYYGTDGVLQSAFANGQVAWSIPASENAEVRAAVFVSGKPQCMSNGSGISIQSDLNVITTTVADQEMQMVSQIQTTQALTADPDRPGLVICRVGDIGFWDMAKKYRASPEKILSANDMEAEPEKGSLLIIPMN